MGVKDKEAVRRKIEDDLIKLRDARVSLLGEPHGLVVRERDGTPSAVVRIGLRSLIDEVWKHAREDALEEAAKIGEDFDAAGMGIDSTTRPDDVAWKYAQKIRAMKGGA